MLVVLDPDKDRPGRMSASRLKDGIRCPRRYFHKHTAKTKPDPRNRPESKGAQFGTSVHKEIEDILNKKPRSNRSKAVKDLARLMLATQVFSDPQVELRFGLMVSDLVWFYGFIDIVDPELGLDWKTSSDPEAYCITREEMLEDPQGVIYSLVIMLLQDLEQVLFRWVYGSSRTGTVGPIKFKVYKKQECLETLEYFVSVAEYLMRGSKAEHFEQNFDACGDFGGCPWQSQCPQPDFLDEILAS